MKSIKREITYKRKLNESYQVFTFEEGDLLIHELEMLRKNQLQSLLPIEFMVSDGKGQFWYGITGLQSLEDMIKTGHMHLETLECMIKGIASALRSVEEYLLREQALSFEQIYFSHDGKRVYFAYYPLKEEYETDAKQQLLRLLDDLIKEADYSDKGYVLSLMPLPKQSWQIQKYQQIHYRSLRPHCWLQPYQFLHHLLVGIILHRPVMFL